MTGALRKFVVVLLALGQVVLGSSASGAVCLGRGVWGSGEVVAGCSHAAVGGVAPVAPVEPHGEHEGECACVDAAAPVGRVDEGIAGTDVLADAATLAIVPCALVAEACAVRRARVGPERPPDAGLVLRTTRLLI